MCTCGTGDFHVLDLDLGLHMPVYEDEVIPSFRVPRVIFCFACSSFLHLYLLTTPVFG